jgi:hypothetical protein
MVKAAEATTAALATCPIAAAVVVDRYAAAADIAAAAKCPMVEERVPARDMQQFRAVAAAVAKFEAAVDRPAAAVVVVVAVVVAAAADAVVAAVVADTSNPRPPNSRQ